MTPTISPWGVTRELGRPSAIEPTTRRPMSIGSRFTSSQTTALDPWMSRASRRASKTVWFLAEVSYIMWLMTS